MKNADAHKPLGDDLLQAAESCLGGRSFAEAFAISTTTDTSFLKVF